MLVLFMPHLNRILRIFLFHLGRRVVNRLPMPVVIVLTVVIIIAILAIPYFFG